MVGGRREGGEGERGEGGGRDGEEREGWRREGGMEERGRAGGEREGEERKGGREGEIMESSDTATLLDQGTHTVHFPVHVLSLQQTEGLAFTVRRSALTESYIKMEQGSVGQHLPAVMVVQGTRKGPCIREPSQCNALVKGSSHLHDDKKSFN